MSIIRKVRDLQVGDFTTSGWTVLSTPVRGLRTPAGKHEVVIYKDGVTRVATWCSSTRIGVISLS